MEHDPIQMAIESRPDLHDTEAYADWANEHAHAIEIALRQHQQDGGWRDSRVPTLEALISLRKSGKHQCKITEQLEPEILALAADIRKSPAPKKENDDERA